jgi:hypothetical protein
MLRSKGVDIINEDYTKRFQEAFSKNFPGLSRSGDLHIIVVYHSK